MQLLAPLMLVLATWFSCRGPEPEPAAPTSDAATKRFAAPAAMTIELPGGTVGGRDGDTAHYTLPPPGVRSPRTIALRALPSGSDAGATKWELTESEGGSGGSEYELAANRAVCGRVIEVRCRAQQELATPPMDWCMAAAATLSCAR